MTDPISNERLGVIIGALQETVDEANQIELWKIDALLALRELQSRRQSPAGVEVKGLEWHGPDFEDEYWAAWDGEKYVIRAETVNGRWLGGVGGYFPSVEAAKAAAQADYERRILSSLSVKEPAGVEPVAWQRRLKYSDVAGAVPQWQNCSAAEATGHFENSPYHEYRSLYASPPKAVTITDEMVEAAK